MVLPPPAATPSGAAPAAAAPAGAKRPYHRKVVHAPGGPTPTRGRGVISAKECEGEVVWAKAANGVWWPAQVQKGALLVSYLGCFRTMLELLLDRLEAC